MNSNIQLIHWNANGLRNRLPELKDMLFREGIMVAAIQESLLTEDVDIRVPHFAVYRKDRSQQGGRGLVTLVHESLTAEKIDESTFTGEPDPDNPMEILAVKIWVNSKQFFNLVNIYNSPSNRGFYTEVLRHSPANTIYAGDFNAHSELWLSEGTRNIAGEHIEDLLLENLNRQVTVIESTSTKQSYLSRTYGTESTPDVSLATLPLSDKLRRTVTDNDFGSDHSVVQISMSLQSPRRRQRRPLWNHKKANWPAFKRACEAIFQQEPPPPPTNIQAHADMITTKLLSAAKKYIPRGNRKRKVVQFPAETTQAIRERNRLRKVHCRVRTTQSRINMNKASAVARKSVLKAKRDSWRKHASTCGSVNPGKIWRLLNSVHEPKEPCVEPIKRGNVEATDDRQKAKLLNQHFAQIGNQHKGRQHSRRGKAMFKQIRNAQPQSASRQTDELFILPFTLSELARAISKTKTGKAPGPDQITAEMLKNLGPIAMGHLLLLFNRIWTSQIIPQSWKIARIIPIYKGKGKDKTDPASYRPIALTSVLCKTLERMVAARLVWHLEDNNKINYRQAGFRANHRTTDQIAALVQSVENGFQKGEHTLAVLFDFSAAYDSVWHQGLLLKTANMGITGHMYGFIASFIENRKIQTCHNGKFSKLLQISNGVPQGSVLSVVLFLIYINDITDGIPPHIACLLYADDLASLSSSKSINKLKKDTNAYIAHLVDWARRWKLAFNPNKTQVILFTRGNLVATIKMDGNVINSQPTAIYLGVTLDKKLSFKPHVQLKITEAEKRVNAIQRLCGSSFGPDRRTVRKLYLGWVRPILEYGMSAISANLRKKESDNLDKVQNHAARVIAGAPKGSSTIALQIETNLQPLDLRRESLALQDFERGKRLPDSHILKRTINEYIEDPPPKKLRSRTSFVEQGLSTNNPCSSSRDPIPARTTPPTTPPPGYLIVQPNLLSTHDGSLPSKQAASFETILRYPKQQWLHCYTDASKDQQSQTTGGGFLIDAANPIEDSFAGNPGASISEIECKAIIRVMQRILLTGSFLPNLDIVIFSDSKTSLQQIHKALNTGLAPNSNTETVINLAMSMQLRRQCSTHLQYIPGHIGIPGNEKADRLAKTGASLPPVPTPASIQHAYLQIRNQLSHDWHQRILSDITTAGETLREWAINPNRRDPVNSMERKLGVALSQMRINRLPTRTYLFRINKAETDLCRGGCGEPETLEHFLLSCRNPRRMEIRQRIFGLDLLLNTTLQELLYGQPATLAATGCYAIEAINPAVSDPDVHAPTNSPAP